MNMARQGGPLTGLRVLEFAGIGPVPFAGSYLSQLGARVTRVERPGGLDAVIKGPVERAVKNKFRAQLDLKSDHGVEAALTLAGQSDVLIEGYRPGVMERLGLGPETCFARNSDLIYARMTGWGQTGPMVDRAGHDLNYIAVTGALHAVGSAGGPPQIPLNLLGDYGGALYLVVGILAALNDVRTGGGGQVIDCAMIDGVAHMLTGIHAQLENGAWRDERGVNMLDGGSPLYAVYETADGGHMAVTPAERGFYAMFAAIIGVDEDLELYDNPECHGELRDRIAAAFRRRTRAQWTQAFEGTDACVTPVLSLTEAPAHPQIASRGSIRIADGVLRAAPAPRFKRRSSAEPDDAL